MFVQFLSNELKETSRSHPGGPSHPKGPARPPTFRQDDALAPASPANHEQRTAEQTTQKHCDACMQAGRRSLTPEAASVMWLWECRWDLCSSGCNNRDQMGTCGQNSNPEAEFDASHVQSVLRVSVRHEKTEEAEDQRRLLPAPAVNPLRFIAAVQS